MPERQGLYGSNAVESQPPMQPGKAVQTIGILSRPRREQLSVVVPPLLKWLEARGIKPVLDKDTAAAATGGFQGQPAPAVADVSEFLLVLGGDGTILAAARLAASRHIPILPINMGRLGFLTSFTLDELYPALEEALRGQSSISQRVMLQAELVRAGSVVETQCALNERSEEHTSELQSPDHLVCRLLLEKKKTMKSSLRSRDQLLLRIGATKKEARRDFGCVKIHFPKKDQDVTSDSFRLQLDAERLHQCE